MVHVVVTGGGGFLGARLARELLAAGSLEVAGGPAEAGGGAAEAGGGARPVTRLTLIDQAPAIVSAYWHRV